MNERLARLLVEDEDMRVCYRAATRGHFEDLDEILACYGRAASRRSSCGCSGCSPRSVRSDDRRRAH